MEHKFYKILDKNGVEIPDHWSGRRRTYDESKKMVDGLNKNGEHRPYTMVEINRNNMAQQTAISWLKDMLEWNYGDPQKLEITWENLDDLLERAKQMEKEQIMNAYDKVSMSTPEQYYNETYKQ